MRLPTPAGPVSELLIDRLQAAPGALADPPGRDEDPLGDDDLQLALYVANELHYQGFEGVDDAWEWETGLVAFRRELELRFEARLLEAVGEPGGADPTEIPRALHELLAAEGGPSLSRYLEVRATLEELREFVIHRSAYQLKEADPHTWAIPRLRGAPKAALVEIQHDEYGGGRAERMHSALFAGTMEVLELDPRYGAYLDRLPGVTLATVNLMTLFGFQRRWRGALVGHLALFEMASSQPNRRYGNAVRRLGHGWLAAAEFYDEHVEADSVHENIAAYDLAGRLALDEPELADDVLFGARALLELDRRFDEHLLGRWSAGRSSLRSGAPAPLVA